MNSKILSTVLVIMAVALYTAAVIDFMQGDVLQGVSDVLMACSDIIIVWTLKRQDLHAKALVVIGNSHCDLMKALLKGVPARLTIEKNDDDDDEEKLKLREENAQQAEKIEHLEAELKESTAQRIDLEQKLSQLTTAEG